MNTCPFSSRGLQPEALVIGHPVKICQMHGELLNLFHILSARYVPSLLRIFFFGSTKDDKNRSEILENYY